MRGSYTLDRVATRKRKMRVAGATAFWVLALPAFPALAQSTQPPTEQVTVNATRLQDQIHSFVESFAAPSPVIGKLARWRDGICPVAGGTPDALKDAVVKRVRAIAAMVGAPVAPEPCKGNIDIVFTYSPQVLLDDVRDHHPVLLGYHDVARAEELATVRHTVQSWYATQTADMGGTRNVDDKQTHASVIMSVYLPSGRPGATVPVPFEIRDARVQQVTGNHMDDGLHSELFHVIVTVNAARIRDDQIPGITDYVAMLALAQTTTFETCADLPSIANIVTDNCPSNPQVITEADLAYLRALYKTDTTRTLAQQRRDIAEEMDKALAVH
jgi:hypothetical protein